MRTLTLCLALAGATSTAAQPGFVSEASTDQETYAYGETITFRYRIMNGGDEPHTIWGSPLCVVGITYGSLTLPDVCTTIDEPFPFEPGESMTWAWVLVPAELGVPETDGTQTIWGHRGTFWPPENDPATLPLAASATFEAPQYLGGPLSVGFDQTDADSVAALREAVHGEVVESFAHPDGAVSEDWRLDGTALPDALNLLRASGVIRYAERPTANVFAVAGESDPKPAALTPPAPNPTATATAFTVRLAAPEAVTVDLVDALGRRVAVLHDGPLAAGADHRFVLSTTGFPAGVYVVRVLGRTVRQSHRVTVAR